MCFALKANKKKMKPEMLLCSSKQNLYLQEKKNKKNKNKNQIQYVTKIRFVLS